MSKNKKILYTNRELSWLAFNQRVLNEAMDTSVPVLDRLFFLSVTASNLDEFIMVRVGGLKLMIEHKSRKKDFSGMTPRQQMSQITKRVKTMIENQYNCFSTSLSHLLEKNNICRLFDNNLDATQRFFFDTYFEEELFPVLTPIAIRTDRNFPLLRNLSLHIAVRFELNSNSSDQFAIIPVPANFSRFIFLPSDKIHSYVLLEDLIIAHAQSLFPGFRIIEAVPFRITRNADLTVREDLTPDFMAEMENILKSRKSSDSVRLEIAESSSTKTRSFLQKKLGLSNDDTFLINGPLDLSAFSELAFMDGFQHLRYAASAPQPPAGMDMQNSIFDEISRSDFLLCHPFESFDPVLKLIEEAARDPHVIAIKQTLYRTASNSRVMDALMTAVENGKHVTAIVELKARFDEARNIERAVELERAGAQIIYGIKNLKTHSKVCVVVRRESNGIARYMHFGTGNYNEKTARLYTDISYLTKDVELGKDASKFLNMVTGYSEPQKFLKISCAPLGLREALLEYINEETERSRQGQKAVIMAKMNSLVDPDIINALYAAAHAGVTIKLNVRGICCLRAGVKGLSKKISVVSIVDRYLEHSRIFYFYHGGTENVFISSADWMPRNLDRRIELMVPVGSPPLKKRLIHILETCLNDKDKGYFMQSDGSYKRRLRKPGKAFTSRSQELLYKEICKIIDEQSKASRKVFEIHKPLDQ